MGIFRVLAWIIIVDDQRISLVINQCLEVEVCFRRCLPAEIKFLAIVGDIAEKRQAIGIPIRFVIVESLKAAKIDGVCVWLQGED